MIINFNPIVALKEDNEYYLYHVENDILYVTKGDTTEEFDFTDFPNGTAQDIVSDYFEPSPIKEAKRADGILYITVERTLPETVSNELAFPEPIDTSSITLDTVEDDPLYKELIKLNEEDSDTTDEETEPEEPIDDSEPQEPIEEEEENISFEVIDEVEDVIEEEVEFEEVEDTIEHETEKSEQELLEEQGILPEPEPTEPIDEGTTETDPSEDEQTDEDETDLEEPQEPEPEPELTEEEIAFNNEMERQALIMSMGYDIDDPEVFDKTLEEIIAMEEEWSRKRKEEEEQREREYQEWLDSLPKEEPTKDVVVLPDGEVIVIGEDGEDEPLEETPTDNDSTEDTELADGLLEEG